MALQEQSANMMPKSEKPSRKNEEKVCVSYIQISYLSMCLEIFMFYFSFSLLDHQNCDARRRKKVQKKRDDFATNTATADLTYANNESHLRVND